MEIKMKRLGLFVVMKYLNAMAVFITRGELLAQQCAPGSAVCAACSPPLRLASARG